MKWRKIEEELPTKEKLIIFRMAKTKEPCFGNDRTAAVEGSNRRYHGHIRVLSREIRRGMQGRRECHQSPQAADAL